MKRFTAIFTVLCLLFAAVSCSGGAPDATGTQSTAAQNTTESSITESTTSKTEDIRIPEKPMLPHPAIEEINAGVEKTLAQDSFAVVVISDFFPTYIGGGTHPAIPQYKYGQALTVAGAGSESPVFSLETKTQTPSYNSGKELPEKNIYFDGESYYVSYMGVNAKIAKSGVNTAAPREFIIPLLAKLPADTAEPAHSVQKEYSIYEIELPKKDVGSTLADLDAALSAEIARRLEGEFELTITSATVTVTVNLDGYITDYNIAYKAALKLGGEQTASYTIESRIETTFIGVGSTYVPASPAEPESYTALASENDIPRSLFNSAADAIGGLDSANVTEEITLDRKELNGSYTTIISNSGTFSAGKGDELEWRKSNVIGIYGEAGTRHEVYYKDGFYYVEETGLKYTPEDFARLFGGSAESVKAPILPEGSVLAAQIVYENGSENAWAPIVFKLSEEAYAEVFADQIEAAVSHVAGEYDLWKYSVTGNTATAVINKEGYLTDIYTDFSIEVIVNINGSKFAFGANVSYTAFYVNTGTVVQVHHLEGYENYTEYKQ
ncbi:MAG: hypothetical protein IJW21_03085 [Clostridia bacterium]|nr:hypothetical protein [Clostridia bacterium]